jgi:hypothetical protein
MKQLSKPSTSRNLIKETLFVIGLTIGSCVGVICVLALVANNIME